MRDVFGLLLGSLNENLSVQEADHLWRGALSRSGHQFRKGIKVLGAGSYGIAFLLDNKRVLKATLDPSEARVMQKVMRSPCDEVVQVDDVFQMNPEKTKQDMFCIVQERLEPPDEEWQEAVRFVGKVLKAKKAFLTPDSLHKYFYPKIAHEGMLLNKPEIKSWLFKLADYFDQKDIRFEDFHGGNVMKLGGIHKMIDLGRSKSQKSKAKMDIVGSVRQELSAKDFRLLVARIQARFSEPFPVLR